MLELLTKASRKPYVAKEPKSYAIFKAIWGRITSDGCLGSMTIATNHINEMTHLKLVDVHPMYMEKYSDENRKSKFLELYSNIKEKREAGQASQESVLEMQNWCENQVNSAFLDETKCLLTNHFVNAKYLFEYRNKVTESYMEKC